MASLIQAQKLYKTYGDASDRVEVLRGVDFEVGDGEAVAVLGASGAGKSTLLHLLGTLDKPSSGQVTFDGGDLFSLSDAKLSRFRNRTMGFVFQFHHLLPMLSARENVLLPLLIAGESKEAAAGRAEEILAKVGLSHRLEHRPAELSGGEQQRVAIARALIARPRVLFADEPTGNLDSKTGEEVADLLMKLHEEQRMTLVIVTHNERLAGRLPRSVLMKDGRLQSL